MNITAKLLFRLSPARDVISRSKILCRGISLISDNHFNRKRVLSQVQFEFLVCRRNLSNNKNIVAKKRLPKKKKISDVSTDGFCVAAYSTAEEYDLENLAQNLSSTKFKPSVMSSEFGNLTDFIHAECNSDANSEAQDVFFFREGSVVMWNIPDKEAMKFLDFLKLYEDNSFDKSIVKEESEVMTYNYSSEIKKTKIIQDNIIFSSGTDLKLEKYAISNAMALSVHLGTYEANLENYIESMEPVTDDLKRGDKIKMSREQVLQKTGQLFALRHNINLSSDLLDTPDFYWDRKELEILYQLTFNYFCISKRTKVMNEKINHCIELVHLLSSHLNDKHHIRLEWMIIILIMVEVAFEIVHYLDRYLESQEQEPLSQQS